MARKPIPPPKRNGHLINGGFALGLALLLGFAIADSRRVMPSTSSIMVTYAIGLIIILVTGFWDFRWQQELSTIGQVIVLYSFTILMLAGQFLLALGTFILFIMVMLYPIARTIRRQVRQQIRDRRP